MAASQKVLPFSGAKKGMQEGEARACGQACRRAGEPGRGRVREAEGNSEQPRQEWEEPWG